MLKDLLYAFRALRHRPGFALTAILSITLGIGATSSVFSFADGLLLRPLPVPRASEVVALRSRTPSGDFDTESWRDYADFRDRNRSFRGLAAYEETTFGFAPDHRVQPRMKGGYLVSGNFFRVLEVEPRLGRGFRPEEDRVPGRDAVVVLGYEFWRTEFASDPSAVGRHVFLNGIDFTIVGVAQEGFTGMDQYTRPSLFIPAMMGPKLLEANRDVLTNRSARVFSVAGRLKPGVSIHSANAEAAALARAIEASDPGTNRAIGAAVQTELQKRMDLDPGAAIISGLMFCVVVVVLAISCANVANLMLSRGRSRKREIAVRLAIGASRTRLVRQLMAESVLVALAGGALGLLMARSFVEVASSIRIPGDVPIELSFQLDARALWFTVAVSLASAVLFGLAPALQATRTDLAPALKAGDADPRRRRIFGQSGLVVAQVAGSLVLLIAAAQILHGFSHEMTQNSGFRTDHVLMMTLDPSLARYTPARTERFYQDLAERARRVAGVESAALASTFPLSTSMDFWETVIPEGYTFPRGQEATMVWMSSVDENLFETLAIPVVRGRGILATDRAGSPLVAVVNEVFARRYLGANPIGKRLRLGSNHGPWIEVVGVTKAGEYFTGTGIEPPTEALFVPFTQRPRSRMTLLVHTLGDPAALAAPMRDVVRSIDPNMPVFGVRTMRDFFEQRSVRVLEVITGTAGSFALIGFALALVGLYAVVAGQVASRTREIGIRMAIGADRGSVVTMVLKRTAAMSLTGVAIGLALGIPASRTLSGAIPALHPAMFALIPAGLLLTSLLAGAIPARRAARVDPMEALRQE